MNYAQDGGSKAMSMLDVFLKLTGRYLSPAELSARARFRAEDPKSRVSWSSVKEEPARFVVGVFYGATRPPRFKFYAVAKADLVATPLENAAEYAPKEWR